jgi:flagellar biogenesis protein FliO
VENTPLDWFRCIGELVIVLGAVYFFIKGVKRIFTQLCSVFCRNAFGKKRISPPIKLIHPTHR